MGRDRNGCAQVHRRQKASETWVEVEDREGHCDRPIAERKRWSGPHGARRGQSFLIGMKLFQIHAIFPSGSILLHLLDLP
jgi:hypothetical protein